MANIKSKIYIIDSSALLSGKQINFDDAVLLTTSGVSNEFTPGGQDYNNFQFLIEKGMKIRDPTKESIIKIYTESKKTGDFDRLSNADKEIIALALDLKNDNNVTILTDDYSIQNVANAIGLKFESISQKVIKKSFKWSFRCTGCGKKFKDNINICPICGSAIKNTISKKKSLKKCDIK